MSDLARTRDILADLVSFPTVSADSNLQLIAYAGDLLSSAGARLSVSLDPSGTKANLFATIGPEGDGGIVLLGHSDVVPVEGQTGAHEAELVSFGTEVGLFQAMGMSAVICGPGSIAQAHKPDEYIEITQLEACLGMLERLSARIRG